MCRRCRILLSGIFVLISMVLMCVNISYAEEKDKYVLFISSYSEDFITIPDQKEGISKILDEENINLHIEYMDTKNFSDDDNISNFHNSIKYKIENGKGYDVVILGDDAALQFGLDYQKELFDGIPIVFFGINDMDRAKLASDNPYMAGSVEKTSLSENIELALSLQPKAKRVVGIVDNTLTGQGDKKQLKDVSEEFKYLEFKALDVSKYSYEEFGAELNKYGMDTIIIFQSMSQDRNGKILNLSEQIEFIKKYTKSPVYRASVGGVGDGLLGGRMIDYEKFGENAARMAVNIMNGTDINSLKELEDTPYYYYFDYKIVEKYNLDIDKFP